MVRHETEALVIDVNLFKRRSHKYFLLIRPLISRRQGRFNHGKIPTNETVDKRSQGVKEKLARIAINLFRMQAHFDDKGFRFPLSSYNCLARF